MGLAESEKTKFLMSWNPSRKPLQVGLHQSKRALYVADETRS